MANYDRMKVGVYINSAGHQNAHGEAMRAGLRRHGIDARLFGPNDEAWGDACVCWGWRRGKRLRASGKNVLVMERGYLGDRFKWTSLGWNGLNGRATFPTPQDNGERFQAHFAAQLQPWKTSGRGYALIFGQVRGDTAVAGVDLPGWYQIVVDSLEEKGIPARFRPHPEELRHQAPQPSLRGVKPILGSLADALADARFAVAYNSNALTDAVMAGVPSFAADEGAIAWPVCAHGLGAAPVRPDRAEWCRRLSWCQWSFEEITSGDAWDVVQSVIGLVESE